MAKTTTQTTRIAGKRVRIVTTTSTKGTSVTVKPAPVEEWVLQSAQVRALRKLPEYGKRFLLAGDQNAAKRGRKALTQALAAGMTAGEADLRIYGENGRLLLIENKVGKSPLTDSQRIRHPALAAVGHPVTVVRATTEEDAARQAVELVRDWIAENAQNAS